MTHFLSGVGAGKHGSAALPHPHFWQELHGLVIDGYQFFFYDRQAGYIPVPKPDHDGPVSALNIQGGEGGKGVPSGGRGASLGPVVTVISGRPAVGPAGRGGGRGGPRGGARGGRGGHNGAAGDASANLPPLLAQGSPRGPPRQKLRKKKGATSAATALPVKAHVKDKE